MSTTIETNVAIIGAGIAGLSAARYLSSHGVKCALFEAKERPGGRVHTEHRSAWPMPIDLGPEFVHGHPAPTLSLIGDDLKLQKVSETRCEFVGGFRPMPRVWERFAALLEPALQSPETLSLADYLGSAELEIDDRRLVRWTVEGYYAAALSELGARAIARDAQSLRDFVQYRLPTGQNWLVERLVNELDAQAVPLSLHTKIKSLSWRPGHVTLAGSRLEEDLTIHARRCLITTSIGVLQAPIGEGGIVFDPYPQTLRDHLASFGMGQVVKVVLRFVRPQWPNVSPVGQACFVHLADGAFPTLWRQTDGECEQITAWAAGPAAVALASQHPAVVTEQALIEVARAFDRQLVHCRRDLLETHHHDFNHDPTTHGAYAYVRAGNEGARHALSRPVDHTLYFGGEALDLQHPGTIAGALGSGAHVARQIVADNHAAVLSRPAA